MMIHVLSLSTAWAANPSRPVAAQAGPSVQRSVLPTAPAATKGEVGGANSGAQKSTASIGGPSLGAESAKSSPKPRSVKPEGNTNSVKSTVSLK